MFLTTVNKVNPWTWSVACYNTVNDMNYIMLSCSKHVNLITVSASHLRHNSWRWVCCALWRLSFNLAAVRNSCLVSNTSLFPTAVCMRGSCTNSPPSSVWKFQMWRGGKFCSSADPPLEVVSGSHYWRAIPVSMDNPEAWSEGVSVWQSDNCTGPSLY